MEYSTPIVTDLRRRTLIMNMNVPNLSPLRKSMSANIDKSLMEESDDGKERAERRAQLEKQRHLMSIQSPIEDSPVLGRKFALYMNMFIENKISAKNAWSVRITEILSPLCRKNRPDQLQIAGTSLDISAKVFSIRVDSTHSMGLNLATNMVRSSDKLSNDNDNEVNDDEGQDMDEKRAKPAKVIRKKKINMGHKTTIVKGNKLTIDKLPKLEPVTFTSRIKTDNDSIEGFVSSIIKQPLDCYLLNNSLSYFKDKTDKTLENIENIPSNLLKEITIQPCANKELYEFIEKNLDEDSDLTEMLDFHRDLENSLVPELDGSVNTSLMPVEDDAGAADDVDGEEAAENEDRFAGNAADWKSPERIVDFRALDHEVNGFANVMPSEYSFNVVNVESNGQYIERIWAGPNHWKLKCLRPSRSVGKFSGKENLNPAGKKKRKLKNSEMVELKSLEEELADFKPIEFNKKAHVSKKTGLVDEDQITLPLMLFTDLEKINDVNLMLKPSFCPILRRPTNFENEARNGEIDRENDCNINPYNYENPEDSMYCSQGDNNDHNDYNDEDVAQEDIGNYAENMVEAPEMVQKNNIGFALKAKKINMGRLKKSIWSFLTDKSPEDSDEPVDKMADVKSFSEVYRIIPDQLPLQDRTNCTAAVAFLSLLHLCNEHNLHLESMQNRKDLKICQN
ncbi:unnamed protein product [Phyllotreta striolata]|uniref:Condensin complex subunit 2 n=1 Tax=Phyllotreta striolata TaxID=444603 RepID=A0A9N9XRK0_PHYSR|nr:unnamed protein product [Phyllotreta striolata]